VIRKALGSVVARASGLRILALVLGIAASVVVARLGGAELKGVASAFAAANAVAFSFINLDLGHQILRHGRENQRLHAVGGLLTRAWALYLALGSLVVVLILAWSVPAIWLVVGAIAFLVGNQASVAATGLRGAVVSAWGAVIQQLVMIAGAVVLAYFGAFTEETVKYVVVASYLVPLLYYLRFLWRGSGGLASPGWRELLRLAWSGLPWQLARLPQMLLLKLDVVVVFMMVGSAAAGIYSVGLSLSMLCIVIPSQFAASALHQATKGGGGSPQRYMTLAALSGVATAAVLAIGGIPAIALLYGPEFDGAYAVMLATLLGSCAYGVMQVQSNYIRILGTGRQLFITNLVGLVVMLVGFASLVPSLAETGAGLAFSLGAAATALFTFAQRRRYFPTTAPFE
jgi:O-antigen/teichoic acid export membrane protein